ncbi:MAG: hypothetical protein ACM3SQ_20465 [Betaproteobacteria bacterium]
MKKLAIGCGVVVVLVIVAATVAFYVVAFKVGSYVRDSGVLASLQTLSKGVVNQAPFTPPANGELTPEMMKRFAGVQESMYAKMGSRFNQIAAMQDEMLRRQREEHRQSTPSEDVKNVSAMMGFVLQAQSAWVDALNEQHFSTDEYVWVRGRVWAAVGSHALELSTRNLSEALKQGNAAARPIQIANPDDPALKRNKQLVAPYLPRAKQWGVFAFFGL